MIELLYFILFIVSINILTGFKRSNVLGCGLVGFSGSNGNFFNAGLIRTLLWHNSITRGKHATGIYTPSMGIIKDSKEAKDFFKDEVKMNLFEENDSYVLGHVRAATVGNASDPNAAHPWDFGNIVMMHNGTLKNHESLAEKYSIGKDEWVVDSQVLGHALSKDFNTDTPFKVLSEYIGAAATIIYHKERQSLFVYRDEERTLYYGYLNDDIYISSMDDILSIIGCSNIKMFDPYRVHEIKDGKILNKIVIKRKKASRNNIVTNIVKKLSSVIGFSYFSSNKIMLDDYYSGFHRPILNAVFFENYHLEARASTTDKSTLGRITAGKFYKPIKILNDRMFTIKDDEGFVKDVMIDLFNYENFIPVPGSYVIAIDAPVNSPVKKGEFYECLYHRFGFDNVVIRDHSSGRNICSSLTNFRVATDKEIREYFEVEDSNSLCSVGDLYNSSMNLIEEYPNKKEEAIVDAEVIIDQTEEDEELDIRDLVIANMLECFDDLSGELDYIVKNKSKELDDETLDSIKMMVMVTSEASNPDFKFLANYNENTIDNLETELETT